MHVSDCLESFLARAAAAPDHAAVRSDTAVSYRDLEDRARRIATAVARHAEPKVLIALPQGADAYAAMIGVGLGGGYYAPLNMSAPAAKRALVAREFAPDVVIVSRDDVDSSSAMAPQARIVDVGQLAREAPLRGAGKRSKLAYVIFTSGSTGTPKGVVISRAALDHYVASIKHTFGIEAHDRVSQHPNIAFDLSVMDIYGALCHGATLCPIAGRGDKLFPARTIAREGITVWISVPSVVSLMARAGELNSTNLKSVRTFCFCGEPLLKEHLDALFQACPSAVVVNSYGPTEATVSMTSLRLTARDYQSACFESVAIGQPIPDMGLHLVGGDAPDEGEIVITGPQLAEGYWNDPAQTTRSFRNLLLNGRMTRGYFSGDWAVRNGGHTIVKGRLDFQVKVHGHRLELDEVAAAIRSAGWPEVCVLVWRGTLAAVIETAQGATCDDGALRGALTAKLEAHAIPAVIVPIAAMPRNENDKIDRLAVSQWLDRMNPPAAERRIPESDSPSEVRSGHVPI